MKTYLLLTLIFFLLLIQLARSLTVTCEAGGPYGTGSNVIVMGNVTGEISNITTVTINISKSGSLKASKTTDSDADGIYFSIFTQSLEIGSYDVNVSASNSTHTANCSDNFEVIPQKESKTCEQVTISVTGNAIYATGNSLSSGRVFVSIEGTTYSNSTTFSNGEFSVYLASCLYLGKKYLLQLSIMDNEGKKGTVYIPFIPT